jgi:hypothetical protein
LVFGSRADRLLSSMRTGFYSDIAGLEVFAGLFAYHQLPAHFANEHTDWVDLNRFRCVFAVGDVMAEHGINRLVEFARRGGRVVVVGDAGQFCPEKPGERDLLRKRLAGLANVKLIAAPDQKAPSPGDAFRASLAFREADLDAVLSAAGVRRRVRSETPGFECVRKHDEAGGRVYVAVFRRYPGEYENIWYDDETEKKWGRQPARVVVNGLADGNWKVEKFHRTASERGNITVRAGDVVFETEPAMVGELQLYRLTKEK